MSTEKEAKSNELRNGILIALLTATITAAGFIGKDYFESKSKRKEYVRELHKKLYDKGAEEFEKVNSAYSELYALYSNGYALSTYEQEPRFKKLQDAIESYAKYLKELERYGNSAEVQVAKNVKEWLREIYSSFYLQYKSAEDIQRVAKELLLIEHQTSDLFKFMNMKIDNELDRFMNLENTIFYDLGWYQKPIVHGLERHLYYQFRTAIGLDVTSDMAKTINELPKLAKRKDDTVYKDSKTPFLFAAQRVMQAPTLEFKGDNGFFEQKNAALKEQIKMKFLALVIDNDKELQAILKERKAQDQKGG